MIIIGILLGLILAYILLKLDNIKEQNKEIKNLLIKYMNKQALKDWECH
jgi:hypothetical protein